LLVSKIEEEGKDEHKYCRGGGGNNFNCGCKYNIEITYDDVVYKVISLEEIHPNNKTTK